MKNKWAKILFASAITALSIGFSANTQEVKADLVKQANGEWHYYYGDEFRPDYTGLDKNQYGWWYVKNGIVDFTYNGSAKNQYGLWLVRNGKVDFGFTGIAQIEDGQYRVVNGKVDYYYYGLMYSNGVWYNLTKGKVANEWYDYGPVLRGNDIWYANGGQVDFGFTGVAGGYAGGWFFKNGKFDNKSTTLVKCSDGIWRHNYKGYRPHNQFYSLVQNQYGWWAVKKGEVIFNFKGLISNNNGTWFVKNGKVDFSYTGEYKNNERYGDNVIRENYYLKNGKVQYTYNPNDPYKEYKWLIKNGKVDYGYTGVAKIKDEWCRVVNGHVDYNFSGLAKNEYGWWYIKDGIVDFTYSGVVFDGSNFWVVEKGKVDFSYNGFYVENDYTCYFIKNGKADFSYTGLYKDDYYGYRYVREGRTNWYQYGLVNCNGQWLYLEHGCVDYEKIGIVSNENGKWIVRDGKVDFSYNGIYEDYKYVKYNIKNGKVIE